MKHQEPSTKHKKPSTKNKEPGTKHKEPINDFSRYRVGLTTHIYEPHRKVFKFMLHLVAYDITNPKRLRRVAKTCEDYGMRVEYSLFECDLDEERLENMRSAIKDIMDPDEDSLLIYRLCASCVQRIEAIGSVTRPEKVLLYFP